MRTRLVYKNTFEIVDGSLAIITLTDMEERRAINITASKMMGGMLTLTHPAVSLPGVLCAMLGMPENASRYEITITDLVRGQYQAVVTDTDTFREYPIHADDGILLMRLSSIPLYIRSDLFMRQSVKYEPGSNRTSLPVNILPTRKLREELDKAIKEEDYRRASVFRDVLNERLKEEKGASNSNIQE